ncbi:MAG: DUF4124 domain-containing protein [Pseudomonadota bacterium]
MRSILFIGLSFSLTFPAYAEIYKYVDEGGRVTYSNLPIKGGKKVDLPEVSSMPMPAPKPSQTTAPSNFPKVDGKTQRDRDDVRRKILEDELKTEEKALSQAQQALQEGEGVRNGNEKNYQKYLDRIQGLKDNLDLHEKNVSAIRKELAGLK